MDDYAQAIIASVLAAVDGSEATRHLLDQKAKLQRYEVFVDQIMENASADLKDKFDRVMHSTEFAKRNNLEPLASEGSIKFTFDEMARQNATLKGRVRELEDQLTGMKDAMQKTRVDALKEI